jgi:hypothetical protein
MTAKALFTPGVKNAVPPLTGLERIFSDNGSAQGEMIMVSQIVGLGTIGAQVYNTSALAAAGTLTAAQVTGGNAAVFLDMTGAFSGAANIQLPTVASVVAALGASQGVGSTYRLRVINPSGQTLTITTNTGWTFGANGSYALLMESFRDFLVTITSATTATFQDVGGGAVTAE